MHPMSVAPYVASFDLVPGTGLGHGGQQVKLFPRAPTRVASGRTPRRRSAVVTRLHAPARADERARLAGDVREAGGKLRLFAPGAEVRAASHANLGAPKSVGDHTWVAG